MWGSGWCSEGWGRSLKGYSAFFGLFSQAQPQDLRSVTGGLRKETNAMPFVTFLRSWKTNESYSGRQWAGRRTNLIICVLCWANSGAHTQHLGFIMDEPQASQQRAGFCPRRFPLSSPNSRVEIAAELPVAIVIPCQATPGWGLLCLTAWTPPSPPTLLLCSPQV